MCTWVLCPRVYEEKIASVHCVSRNLLLKIFIYAFCGGQELEISINTFNGSPGQLIMRWFCVYVLHWRLDVGVTLCIMN